MLQLSGFSSFHFAHGPLTAGVDFADYFCAVWIHLRSRHKFESVKAKPDSKLHGIHGKLNENRPYDVFHKQTDDDVVSYDTVLLVHVFKRMSVMSP